MPCLSRRNSQKRLFIPQETNFVTLKYKGNFWSRMKGRRDDERTSATPGPGCYEHETKKSCAQIRDERIREAKRAASKQPRFLEALCQQKLHQVILKTSFTTFMRSSQYSCVITRKDYLYVYELFYGNYFPKEFSSSESLRSTEKCVR